MEQLSEAFGVFSVWLMRGEIGTPIISECFAL